MRIEVNLDKKFLVFSLLIGLLVIGLVGVYAYNSAGSGGNPAIMGHSVDEMDWSKAIGKNITAAGFCIGNSTVKSCVNSWGSINSFGDSINVSGNNITLNGHVGIMTSPSSENALIVDGNTRILGNLSAWGVCISGDCRTGWPSGLAGTLSYDACEWVDGGQKPQGAWSTANCSAIGKIVAGFHFLKSNNDRENTEYEVTPDYVRAQRVNDGSWMHAWAYCCKISIG